MQSLLSVSFLPLTTMWAWRSRPTICPLSLSTFIEHLPSLQLQVLQLKPLNKPQQFRKSISTCALKSLNSESLTPQQHHQVSLYVDALLQWNQKMNLTAVTDKSEVMERHVQDSLAIIPPIRDSYASLGRGSSCESLNLVDVGSGAGLPGLILAIACPSWKVTLMESLNKRCLFLDHAIGVTGLTNVRVLRGRAESFGQSTDSREAFDVAVARAVAEMRVLAEYCLPLVRVGGLFVAAKGHDPGMEVRSAEKVIGLLGASVLKQFPVESFGPYGQRTAIVCLKEHPTPRKYPRDPGTPAKMPL